MGLADASSSACHFFFFFLLLLPFPSPAAPTDHLVTQLPGQPSVGFKQYAGYINVDESAGTNLFYYFAEAEANASSLPLAVWLNGGPGCSSIGGGGFTELGPFYPNSTGNGLRRNPNSWNKVANLLFLESPAGVGWSYSDKTQQQQQKKKKKGNVYNYDDSSVAKESLVFVRRWFERFPEYTNRQLFLAGESYAGHYIPQLASLLVRSEEFNLKGILIGNPLLNYGVDTSATYSFLWSHGAISDDTFDGVSRWCDFRYGYMGGDHRRPNLDKAVAEIEEEEEEEKRKKKKKGCASFLGSATDEIGSLINIYDLISDVCPPPIHRQALLLHTLKGVGGEKEETDVCVDHEITRYLNQRSVQEALHANLTSLPYPWEACSRIVNYSYVDKLGDMLPALAHLAKQDLPIWIFSGDQDSVVPLTGTRSQITKLAQSLNLNRKGRYRPWYSYGQVGGWCEAYGDGKLVYATVRGASHMVPYTQPERALVLFASFLSGKFLPSKP